MCGIVGVIQYKSAVPKELRQKALKILFSEAMLKTETRGKDATGLFQVMSDGDWMMAKKAQKSTDWLFVDRSNPKCEDPVVYADFVDSWGEHPQELSTLVGHCRAKTVGSTANENNHPFAIQLDERNALLGVHNGTLYNHEMIFERLPQVVERQGSVDSEAIFHLLYYLTEQGTKPITSDTIQSLGKKLDGSYACVVVNSRFPNKIAVFRNERPLELFMIAPINIVIVVSVKSFVDSALEKYSFIRRLIDPTLPELRKEDRMLPERDFRIFDTELEFPKNEKMVWNDFETISQKGEVRRLSEELEDGWKDPKNSKPVTKPYGSYNTGMGGAGGAGAAGRSVGGVGNASAGNSASSAKTTKPGPASSSKLPVALPAKAGAGNKAGDDDASVLVEMEIGSEADARKAYEKAASLGICTHHDTLQEVAESSGRTETAIKEMGTVELANILARTYFNMGYAVSRVDTKNESSTIRRKGREALQTLEKSEEKKKRAQNHVWEYKAVIQLLLALAKEDYVLDADNIDLLLSAFPGLNEQRKKDVLKAARELLGSEDTRQLVGNLVTRCRVAERGKMKVRNATG